MSKVNLAEILNQLSAKSGGQFSQEHHELIKRRLNRELSYTPRVAIFGKTGAGKSSLLNALFGQDISPTSDVAACTRDAIEHTINTGRGSFTLIDCPGVGESHERDQEYHELYRKLLEGSGDQGIDMILWVLKGDDRAFTADLDFYQRVVKPAMDQNLPFLFILNQVDKIEPYREWDQELNEPGINQMRNIKEKCSYVSTCFSIPTSLIVPVAAMQGYQVGNLMYEIITHLRSDRVKVSLSRVMNPKHKTPEVQKEAKSSYGNILERVIETVWPAAGLIWKGIKSFFF